MYLAQNAPSLRLISLGNSMCTTLPGEGMLALDLVQESDINQLDKHHNKHLSIVGSSPWYVLYCISSRRMADYHQL